MNDFTKEELEQLSFAIHAYTHAEDDHIYDDLRSKIKAMIDNLCEHEHLLAASDNSMYAKCNKCGHISWVAPG